MLVYNGRRGEVIFIDNDKIWINARMQSTNRSGKYDASLSFLVFVLLYIVVRRMTGIAVLFDIE